MTTARPWSISSCIRATHAPRDIPELLRDVKDIAKFATNSTKFAHRMRQSATAAQPYYEPQLSNDTRWDSTWWFMMLESIVRQMDSLSQGLQDFSGARRRSRVPPLTEEQMTLLRRLYQVLGMLRNVTVQSQEKERSITAIIPFYYNIVNCCELCKQDSDVNINQFGCILH